VAVDGDLLAFYQRAIALRRKEDALRRGGWAPDACDDEAQFFAFRRTLGQRLALVALNRGEQDYRWALPDDAHGKLDVALLTSGDERTMAIEGEGASRSILVPGLAGVVLINP
jgi:hypothetical protein